MRTRSQTSGRERRRESRSMEDDCLKLDAKRNKALKSKAARQKEKEYKEKLRLEVKRTEDDIKKLTTEKSIRQQHIEHLESLLKKFEIKLYGKATSGGCDLPGSSASEFAFIPPPTDPSTSSEWHGFPQDLTAPEELGLLGISFSDESREYSSAMEGPSSSPAQTFQSEGELIWTSISEQPDLSSAAASLSIPSSLDFSEIVEKLGVGNLPKSSSSESGVPSPSHELCRPSTSSALDISSEDSSSAIYTTEGTYTEQSQKKTTKKSKSKDKQYTYQQPPRKDPEEEEKRRRAVKAYENRKKKKEHMSNLESQILHFKQQIEQLRQQKEVIQQRIDILQASSGVFKKQ